MKYSTKSRYALRLMVDLARHEPGQYIALKEISESQQISLKYLEQIVTPLARARLLKSGRGSRGGYCLTKAPAEYTAGEILRAVEGDLAPIPCLEDSPNLCPRCGECSTLGFWQGMDAVVNRYADSVSLAQLALPDVCDPGAGI